MTGNGVSIIIPNFNGEVLLKMNLPAVLEASEAYPEACEVIVVDDASQDRSVDLIATHFPWAKLVRQETNKGFADTIHTGIQHAVHEYLILLNSDVRPEPGFIAPLMAHFQNPTTFSVSPLVCDPDGTPQTVSWNLGMIRRGSIKFRSWDLEEAQDRAKKGQPLKSLFASGGSVALRKTMFHQLGGFLPLYKPFYYEDVDLCTRAWIKGWQTLFEPRSRVIHDHAGVIRLHFDARRVRTTRLRNRFFYLWLYLSGKGILTSHIPGILYRALFRTLQLDMTYMAALLLAGSRLKDIVSFRTQVKSRLNAVKPLEEILREIEKQRPTSMTDMKSISDTNDYEYTFTVFIPTYNRAHTLGRALQSIADQTFNDLEVVIIDDGSTDNTHNLVDEWREKAWFPIQYHWQENQGKHVAHNNALKYAKGFFFVLLDSDDMLHPKALERLKYHWDTIPDEQKHVFAGVEGLCIDSRGNVSRDKYPFDVMDSNYLEIAKKYNVMGDKKNAIRTQVLRQFPYPHFQGERHVRDDLIWKRISIHYKFRYINEPIQIIEYQPDGLSADVFSMRMRNPRGFRFYYLEEVNTYSALTRRYLRFKYHTKFVRYSLHCGVGFFQQYREVRSKFLWMISVPRGVIGWLEDRAKMLYKGI